MNAPAEGNAGARGFHSIQLRLAVGYAFVIAAVLLLLNTYPLFMTQDMLFRSKKEALVSQSIHIANNLSSSETLSEEGVEKALSVMEDLNYTRAMVTDETGLTLYDSGEESLAGTYALVEGIVEALRGNDAFFCAYRDGVFRSWSAVPVMRRGRVVGSVCLYASDNSQGTLLQEIQSNFRLISGVVCLLVLILSRTLSYPITRRIGRLLGAIQVVREGEYSHRIQLTGRDELTQLGEAFNEMTEQLQATEAARRRFVSDASHELKTPLASIKLLSDSILQDASMDSATMREFVVDIGEAADRLISISQELLSLNQLDESRPRARTPVDLTQVAQGICRMLLPLAQAADVRLHTQLTPGCVALGNEKDFSLVVENLLENAIKYNRPQGEVWVTSWWDNAVHLTVADSGMGIPQEDLPRIFERFYRVDKARSRQAGGTGLGLSIVRDTLASHGGSIAVERREEGGVCFSVELPLYAGEEGAEG